ncbi:MAG: AAC(3) family N-acetyltransferase, partial [Vicinamibacterales bacterium]
QQNGCDYAFYEGWSTPAVPFRIEAAPVDPKMGAMACAFAALPGARRSDHAWHSWAAIGPDAARLLDPHPWSTTNLPLERLAATDAAVVLVGVGLTACTAVHVSEERAGRRPFIRWATDRDGAVRRVRVAGCSRGFDALEPLTGDLFVEARIGGSRVRVAPLAALIERCAEVIRERPALTICADTCLRCRDGARGGPIEDSLSQAAS